jgi:hypothetical protein
MRRMETVAREIERPHPAMLLNIAFSGRPNLDEEVRRLSMEYTGDATLFGLARAHVVLMSGLGGTAVRAFMATFILMGRPPRPTKVFSGIDDAARWLIDQAADTDLPWSLDAVRSVVDVVRPSAA